MQQEDTRVDTMGSSDDSLTASGDKLIQPLPWTAAGRLIHDANGFALTEFTADEAEFITRACNAHAELVAALKRVQSVLAWDGSLPRPDDAPDPETLRAVIDAAIAKAEGR